MAIELPTLHLPSITPQELDALMELGFCYVQLPTPSMVGNLQTCLEAGRKFFSRPYEEKMQWALDETLDPTEQGNGYVVRSDRKSLYKMEQFFLEPGKPLSFLEPHENALLQIHDCFFHQITLPIINAIFAHSELSAADFIEATTSAYRLFAFQSYPALEEGENVIRFNAHKDFGLFTVLFYEEPGLELYHHEKWHAVAPKPGTVVINIGNALELMTNGRCRSALHRVIDPANDRKSIVFFINPSYQRPVKNYVTGALIAETGADFFKAQFEQHYT